MTDDKKKGDFEKWHKPDEAKGGDKKAHQHPHNSTGADKQNTGTGGHKG